MQKSSHTKNRMHGEIALTQIMTHATESRYRTRFYFTPHTALSLPYNVNGGGERKGRRKAEPHGLLTALEEPKHILFKHRRPLLVFFSDAAVLLAAHWAVKKSLTRYVSDQKTSSFEWGLVTKSMTSCNWVEEPRGDGPVWPDDFSSVSGVDSISFKQTLSPAFVQLWTGPTWR